MKEQFFKKSALSILFGRLAKMHPDKKQFLMELWDQIKAVGTECTEKCEECEKNTQCSIASEAASLFSKYHSTEDSDKYWSDLVHDSSTIYEKYGKHRFAKRILADVVEELSECEKERQKGA